MCVKLKKGFSIYWSNVNHERERETHTQLYKDREGKQDTNCDLFIFIFLCKRNGKRRDDCEEAKVSVSPWVPYERRDNEDSASQVASICY